MLSYLKVLCIGRIKIRVVKGNAKELVSICPEKFSKDFDVNKNVLKEMDVVESRHIRNKMAGYIAGLVKRKAF